MEKEDKKEIKEIVSEVVNENRDYKNNIHYKGAFVNETIEYMRKKTPVKISSFVSRSIAGIIVKADSQKIIIRKFIDGKNIMLTQASIKTIEEI
ncbi:MAG: hypothetical protein QW478_14220 [Candidatus Micrarchaeaceae archaeon]